MALKAIALMGATGTGKSDLAMKVARTARTSLICCDSMQLYRGLDIGTAKPTEEERAEIPHYLVDCCDFPDMYSAARWADEARDVIAAENKLGRVPLIVGGTGLYLKALTKGFADIPPEKPEVRERLESVLASEGTSELYKILQVTDPDMAARLKEGDTQRIMRALAVCESSGKALSVWQKQAADIPAIDCPVFVLDVARDVLRPRLADRCHAMMDAGWLDETRWLHDQNLPNTHPAMRAVGYRQLLDHLHGESSATKTDLEKAVTDSITATRRYAKRQVTWFNHQTAHATHGNSETLEKLLMQRLNEVLKDSGHG